MPHTPLPAPPRIDVQAGAIRLSAIRRDPPPGVPVRPVPFLLLHGLASNARLWDGVGAALAAAGYPSVALDQRGHGRSDKPGGGYDYATVCADAAAAIDALGLDRPIVVGQSWGGNVVVELAARHPDRVRGVVAVDGGMIALDGHFPTWEACRDALAPPRLAGTPQARMEAWIRDAHPDWPEAGITGTLENFRHLPDGTIAPWLAYDDHLAILREIWENPPQPLYPGLRVPVLFLPAERPGDGSPLAAIRRGATDDAALRIPVCRVRWFHDADHDVHAQLPDEVAGVMIDAVRDGFFPA
ncbi:MAG: alpha/beta fold hydrolase [Chloroflexota bacterium]